MNGVILNEKEHPMPHWQHTGIQDVFRLRRLQVRRGAGRTCRQRSRHAPRLAAVRRGAGCHPRDDGWQWNMLFPPRRQQERHAEDCCERSVAGEVRLRSVRRGHGYK